MALFEWIVLISQVLTSVFLEVADTLTSLHLFGSAGAATSLVPRQSFQQGSKNFGAAHSQSVTSHKVATLEAYFWQKFRTSNSIQTSLFTGLASDYILRSTENL
jgi:hypothetical protein